MPDGNGGDRWVGEVNAELRHIRERLVSIESLHRKHVLLNDSRHGDLHEKINREHDNSAEARTRLADKMSDEIDKMRSEIVHLKVKLAFLTAGAAGIGGGIGGLIGRIFQ